MPTEPEGSPMGKSMGERYMVGRYKLFFAQFPFITVTINDRALAMMLRMTLLVIYNETLAKRVSASIKFSPPPD